MPSVDLRPRARPCNQHGLRERRQARCEREARGSLPTSVCRAPARTSPWNQPSSDARAGGRIAASMAVASGTKLFGTDGVRGVAGEFLTAELAFALGRAIVWVSESPSPEVLVVRDTRVSGEMLEAALCAGIAAAGGQALLAGVLPTPAASILVRRFGLELAAVSSASHNPFRDNGIKFFDRAGRNRPHEPEAAVKVRAPPPRGTVRRL